MLKKKLRFPVFSGKENFNSRFFVKYDTATPFRLMIQGTSVGRNANYKIFHTNTVQGVFFLAFITALKCQFQTYVNSTFFCHTVFILLSASLHLLTLLLRFQTWKVSSSAITAQNGSTSCSPIGRIALFSERKRTKKEFFHCVPLWNTLCFRHMITNLG